LRQTSPSLRRDRRQRCAKVSMISSAGPYPHLRLRSGFPYSRGPLTFAAAIATRQNRALKIGDFVWMSFLSLPNLYGPTIRFPKGRQLACLKKFRAGYSMVGDMIAAETKQRLINNVL